MQTAVFEKFAEHGVLGLIVIALGWWVILLHRELREARAEHMKDVKAGGEAFSTMTVKIVQLGDILQEATDDLRERKKDLEDEHNRRRPR